MSAIAFSQLRKNLGEIIERVHDNEEAITVTRADGKNVVIIPESEWESRNDTAYLLSSPENAKRLLNAKKQVEAEIERRKKQAA
jgi:antitoxin YefM